jgi:hypothetical protein
MIEATLNIADAQDYHAIKTAFTVATAACIVQDGYLDIVYMTLQKLQNHMAAVETVL